MEKLPVNYDDTEFSTDDSVEYYEAESYYPNETDNKMPTYDDKNYYPGDYDERYDKELQQQRIELANTITNTIGKVVESREKRKQIEAITKKEIVKIGAKYRTAETVLNEEFKQRENSLDELYEKLKSDNETIVLEAMRQIGNLHSSTPMQGLKEVSRLYEDNIDKLLEDF